MVALKNDFFSLAKHNTEVSLLKDMTPMMMKDTIEIEPHPMGKFCHQFFVTNTQCHRFRWDKSNNDFPVELAEVDLLKHENKEESSSISPDGEKTVPVVIRWHEPAKSGKVGCVFQTVIVSILPHAEFGQIDQTYYL